MKLSKLSQIARIPSLQLFLTANLIAACAALHESENAKLIAELENSLRHELLDAWYPVSVDTIHGGFLPDFTFDWQPQGRQNKMIVTQCRHVWTASQAAMFFNETRYRKIAAHGFHFLKEKMWDEVYGGFYWSRNQQGGATSNLNDEGKTAYGNAFAIFALSSYFEMSGDRTALRLAQETFAWLDKHSHDEESKGYLDRMTREGTWLSLSTAPMSARARTQAGWKDQNSSIHLMEAFTALYQVWPDGLLRQRLLELLILIRDTMTHEKGYLTLFFERDWRPVSFRDSSEAVRGSHYYFDHVSFGHDVETAYLMLEASHVLELDSDTTTLHVAKKMIDHALARGWDEVNGGFYYQGYYFKNADTLAIINPIKEWWVQAEALNALLLMASLFPQEKKYDTAFHKQWHYMKKYLIDHERGGWYKEGLDQSPEQIKAAKGSEWKVNYHEARALMNCIKMLKAEHELLRSNRQD